MALAAAAPGLRIAELVEGQQDRKTRQSQARIAAQLIAGEAEHRRTGFRHHGLPVHPFRHPALPRQPEHYPLLRLTALQAHG
jgi:hypothetical protein